MQALVWEGAWQMPLQDIDAPEPGPEDVIVAVEAAGICGSDVHGYTGSTGRRFSGIVMGHEFAGQIKALGSAVTEHRIGGRVIVHPILTCGECIQCLAGRPNICMKRKLIGIHQHGAYSEAVLVPQSQLYPLPDHLTYEQGAFAEPLGIALHAVNNTPFNPTDTIVIVGAGPIGLLTMLAARRKGVARIIVTDRIASRLERAKQLGADEVINVAEQDAVARVCELTQGAGADAAIEAVGITATVQQALALTRTAGHITWIGNAQPEVAINMQDVVGREITIRGTYGFYQEFGEAINALATGEIDVRPLIDRVAPLAEGPDIFRSLADGSLDAVKVILHP